MRFLRPALPGLPFARRPPLPTDPQTPALFSMARRRGDTNRFSGAGEATACPSSAVRPRLPLRPSKDGYERGFGDETVYRVVRMRLGTRRPVVLGPESAGVHVFSLFSIPARLAHAPPSGGTGSGRLVIQLRSRLSYCKGREPEVTAPELAMNHGRDKVLVNHSGVWSTASGKDGGGITRPRTSDSAGTPRRDVMAVVSTSERQPWAHRGSPSAARPDDAQRPAKGIARTACSPSHRKSADPVTDSRTRHGGRGWVSCESIARADG